MESIATDYLGNKLLQEDFVLYTCNLYSDLIPGKIRKITEQNVIIDRVHRDFFSHQVVAPSRIMYNRRIPIHECCFNVIKVDEQQIR